VGDLEGLSLSSRCSLSVITMPLEMLEESFAMLGSLAAPTSDTEKVEKAGEPWIPILDHWIPLSRKVCPVPAGRRWNMAVTKRL